MRSTTNPIAIATLIVTSMALVTGIIILIRQPHDPLKKLERELAEQAEIDRNHAMQRVEEADVVSEMVPIRAKLRAYRDQNGELPATITDLVGGSVSLDDLKDHWGNIYHYEKRPNGEFNLFSAGADGQPNTIDDIYFPSL